MSKSLVLILSIFKIWCSTRSILPISRLNAATAFLSSACSVFLILSDSHHFSLHHHYHHRSPKSNESKEKVRFLNSSVVPESVVNIGLVMVERMPLKSYRIMKDYGTICTTIFCKRCWLSCSIFSGFIYNHATINLIKSESTWTALKKTSLSHWHHN